MDIPIALFVLLISLVAHEFAHGWAALRLGDDTALRMGRLSFNPMVHLDPIGSLAVPLFGMLIGGFIFGWARPVPVNPNRFAHPVRDHAIVAAAGPASNLVLAFICAVLLGLVTGWAHANPGAGGSGSGLVFFSTLLEWGITLNVLLAVFNLIPVPPLDGSWIMRTFLRGGAADMYARIAPYGFLIVILLMSTGFGRVIRMAMGAVARHYYMVVYQVERIFF